VANDIPDITLNGTWQDVYSLSGIAVGTSLSVQNKTAQIISLWIGPTAPATSFNGGMELAVLASSMITAGESGYWVKGVGSVFVQVL
jgi:hypothetical protein